MMRMMMDALPCRLVFFALFFGARLPHTEGRISGNEGSGSGHRRVALCLQATAALKRERMCVCVSAKMAQVRERKKEMLTVRRSSFIPSRLKRRRESADKSVISHTHTHTHTRSRYKLNSFTQRVCSDECV